MIQQQSSAWVGDNSPWPQKLQFQKSEVNNMLMVFFEWQGVVHKEFVPEGQTANCKFSQRSDRLTSEKTSVR
jgi:hypothetical protein